MKDKKIIVTIAKNGTVNLETDNYKGASCVKEVKELFKDFLDIDTTIETKADFYEDEEEITMGVDLKL